MFKSKGVFSLTKLIDISQLCNMASFIKTMSDGWLIGRNMLRTAFPILKSSLQQILKFLEVLTQKWHCSLCMDTHR